MTGIDWNTELRTIARQYDGLPPELSPMEARARKAAETREREKVAQRFAALGAIARLLLVASLLGALYWWPYATGCGGGLIGLLAAQAMVVVGGLWTAVFSWRHRLAASHTLALGFVLAGLVLSAAQVLPRLGYVTVAGVDGTQWRCAVADGPVKG